MRTLIALTAAGAFGLAALLFVASPIASIVARQMTFDNPDSVAEWHAAIFMAVVAGALVGGWLAGWTLVRQRSD